MDAGGLPVYNPAMPLRSLDNLRIAIVHEWFVDHSGSEKVVEQMLRVLPQADLFALVDFLPPGQRGFLQDKPVRTSYIQRLPRARKSFRHYLPLFPHAVEQFDVSDYDIVISSSHAVAKGVLTAPDQLHVCMCYSPIRYAWDLQHDYLRGAGLDRGLKGLLARWVLHYLRLWDVRTGNGVDEFIATSRFIAGRIRKAYGRSSTLIYPPVNLDAFGLHEAKEDFYLCASRMVPYKRTDLIVEAFSRSPHRRLIVIGDGPCFSRVRRLAGPNVTLLGYQDDAVLIDHMRRAKGLVFAAKEDFGIVPLEAQACGTAVVAYGAGGALETVIDGETGVHFERQTVESLLEALDRFEGLASSFSPPRLRAHAQRFAEPRFRDEFRAFMTQAWQGFAARDTGE